MFHMWGWDGGWGMGWAWFSLMHALWWVLLVGGAILLFRAILGPRSRRGRDSALDILRERYARGEIGETEYHERLRHLKA